MPDLPLVIGPAANLHAGELARLIQAAPNLKPAMAGASWVGGRRWDLRFQSGEVLALPEGEAAARKALDQVRAAWTRRLSCSARAMSGSTCAIPSECSIRLPGDPGSTVPDIVPEAPPAAPGRFRHRRRRHRADDLMKRPTVQAPRRLVTALDVGSSKVSALIAEPGDDGRLQDSRHGPAPEPGREARLHRRHGEDGRRDPGGGRAGGADRRDQYRGRLRRLLGRRAGQHRRQRRAPDRRATDRESGHRPIARDRPGIDQQRRPDDPPRASGALHGRRARRA